MRRIPSTATVGSLLVLATLACGHEPTAPRPRPGIKVVSSAAISDTVSATLTSPLVIEVRDSTGALAVGTVVRFQPLPAQPGAPTVLVQELTSNVFTVFAAPTTDARGDASVMLKMGPVAGPNRIVVTVPVLGYTDTVTVTVQPGAPATLRFLPRDTGVTIGGSVQINAAAVDRYGNVRSDPVSFTSNGPLLTVTTAGVVKGTTIGSQRVVGQVGTFSDSMSITVVPVGTIATYLYSSDSSGIVMMNLDGSGYRWLARISAADQAAPAPAWTSAGSVVYSAPSGATFRLFSVAPGSPSALVGAQTPGAINEEWPRMSANGALLAYSAIDATTGAWRLYGRAQDGTIAALHATGAVNVEWRSSPSPDGSKLAYVSGSPNGTIIRVLDVATSTPSTWSVNGQVPRWSPKGDKIAFIPEHGGSIFLMNPDGTGVVALTGWYPELPFDWSPDGKWIIAKSGSGSLDLIDTGTGAVTPMRYFAKYTQPAWKP